MKKKLFLIVAIIIIAVFACMTLVACGGNDGNSSNNEFVEGDGNNGGNNQGEDNNGGNQDNENIVSPDATLKEFLDVWLKSSQKSFYQPAYGDATMVINGNIYWQFDFEDTKYVEITGKNKANYFFGPKGSTNLDNWEIMKLETIDEICNSVNIEEEYLQEVNSPKDILNFAYSICFNDADLDVVFEKKGDLYIGKQGTDFENYTIKIIDKVLTLSMVNELNGEQQSMDFIFTLGSEPIEIPEFLRDALENGGNNQEENKVITSEFFTKFNVATDKKFCLKKDNINWEVAVMDNKVSTELIDNNVRHYQIAEFTEEYLNNYALSNGVWQAYPYTYDKASCDNAPELFNEGMAEVFDVTDSSDLLEVIEASYNIDNLEYIDGKYTGKVGTILEGFIIIVSNNELVFKNDVVEFTYTIGGIQIDIPQEALDAMEEYWQQEQAA